MVIVFSMFLGGSTRSPIRDHSVQRDLTALTKRGFTYSCLPNDRVEITESYTGMKQVFSLSEQSEATIRSWAAARGIPILEINPATIDTTQYVGWYNFWQQLPLSDDPGQLVIIADADGNGNPEIYGLVTIPGSPTIIEARVCEVAPPPLRYAYLPYPGVPTGIVDLNGDSLSEILFEGEGGRVLTDYSQQQNDSLPTTLNFVHSTTNSSYDISYVTPVVRNLDGDTRIDCLYKVGEIDSSDSTFPVVYKVIVEEYDSVTHNLQRVWAMRLPPIGQSLDAIGHFASDDFDLDGKQEFMTTGGLQGSVFVCENTGDNSYALTYQDSVPFVNLYRVTTGDVDGDGKPEFFAVATQGSGQWALIYEADSNNHYSTKLLIHFLSGSSIDFPTYLTADIDGDGHLELLTTSGSSIFIFKSDADNSYRLWYYKHEDRLNGVQVYDFNRDGRMDLVISKDGVDSLGYLKYYSDLYLATPLMSVAEQISKPLNVRLLPSHPNPFNSSTIISYVISVTEHVKVTIFDLLGRQVSTLLDGVQNPGNHSVHWDASGLATGMYLCRLQVGGVSFSNKLLLIR